MTTATTTRPKRILSGVQPSGKLHLGNYFGAVKQHIALQDEGECFYFIADYHALTTIQDAERRPDADEHAVRDVGPAITSPSASTPTRPSSSASPTCRK